MYHVEGLGQRIHWYRREKGYTQQQFANMLGVTPQAVSKWETNQGYPDLTLVPKVAQILGVRIDQLFGRSAEEESQAEPARRNLPDSLGDTDLICIYGDYALYSNVPVKQFATRKVTFADNSEAFLEEISVTNRGSGVIRFIPIPLAMEYESTADESSDVVPDDIGGVVSEPEVEAATSESEVEAAASEPEIETAASEPEVGETDEPLVEMDEPTFDPDLLSVEESVDEVEGTEDSAPVEEPGKTDETVETDETFESIEPDESVEPVESVKSMEFDEFNESFDASDEYVRDNRTQVSRQSTSPSEEKVRILRMNISGKSDVNISCDPDLEAPFDWKYNGEGEPTFDFEDGDLRITMPKANESRNFTSWLGGLFESSRLDLYIKESRLEHCGVRVSGIGDIDMDIPIDHLNLEMSGAGDATFTHVGSVKGRMSGAGDLDIESSGDTDIEVSGAGDIDIKTIDGNFKFILLGAGDVKIGSGNAPTAEINISGAGDINASRVTVGDLKCNITGPGDVTIGRVTGKSEERVEFLGDLKIHERGPIED